MPELLLRSFGLQTAQAAAFGALQRDGLRAGVDDAALDAPARFKAGVGGQGALRLGEGGEIDLTIDYELSYLGTPVLHPVTLSYGETSLYIPDVINTVKRAKTIVMTPVQGRKGTVKEYIAAQDYTITLQGLLVGQDGSFPEAKLRELIRICEAREPVAITSDYIRLFGVFAAVISEENFTRLAGFENLQPFELTLVEDTPIDLVEAV